MNEPFTYKHIYIYVYIHIPFDTVILYETETERKSDNGGRDIAMDKSRPKLIFDEWNYSGILEAISMGIERRIDGRIDITVKLKCNAARYRYI